MTHRLANQHALLTGAGGGIGAAVARAFALQGARCTLVDLDDKPSPEAMQLMADFGPAVQYIALRCHRDSSHYGHGDKSGGRLGAYPYAV